MMANQELPAGHVEDRRSLQRRKVLKAARISSDGGLTHLPCTMREISATGARLQVYEGHMIPSMFDLVVELDGMRAQCEVIWREAGEIGVRFRTPPTMGKPLRLQVVVSSDARAVSTLRRRPITH